MRVVDAADQDALAELGGRFDAVVEATNAPEGAAAALRLLRRGLHWSASTSTVRRRRVGQ